MSLFKDEFKEPTVNFPEKVIQDAIKDFENATHSLASLVIVELEEIDRLRSGLKTTFQFQIFLMSQYLKGYSFKIMYFGYDVNIYPVAIIVPNDTAKELGISKDLYLDTKIIVSCEKDLLMAIDSIFSADRFNKTVGGLMKIARAKKEDS